MSESESEGISKYCSRVVVVVVALFNSHEYSQHDDEQFCISLQRRSTNVYFIFSF